MGGKWGREEVLCLGKGRNWLASRLRRCADFFCQSDINSNADDADKADLRGFCFACGKVFLATKPQRQKPQRHKVPKIENGFWYGFVAILISSRRRRDKNPRKSTLSAPLLCRFGHFSCEQKNGFISIENARSPIIVLRSQIYTFDWC